MLKDIVAIKDVKKYFELNKQMHK